MAKTKNKPNKDCPACKTGRVFRKVMVLNNDSKYIKSDRLMMCVKCGATLARDSSNQLFWAGGK